MAKNSTLRRQEPQLASIKSPKKKPEVHCQIKIASIYAKKKWFKKGCFIDVPSMEKCIAQVTNNAQKNLAKTVFLKFLIA